MTTGKLPFSAATEHLLFQKIQQKEYDFPEV